jgi:hypothetical protein
MEPKGSLPFSQNPTYSESSNTVHTLPPPLIKIHFRVILQSVPVSSKWFFLFTFHDQQFLRNSYLSHACHILWSHSSWFDHPNNI